MTQLVSKNTTRGNFNVRKIDADIDIDVPDREKALSALNGYVNASQINDNVIKKHNVGIYLQDIPHYGNERLSTIDYKKAPYYGFFKIDVLTNNVYKEVNNERELEVLMDHEPDWSMLLNEDCVVRLSQIHHYGDMLKKWRPRSVNQLAMFIAMIRPSKSHLMDKDSWLDVEKEIWEPPQNKEAYFKHSHAVAYAVSIVVQMNLISLGRLE